ncbi:MAG: hypothetical protein GY679_05040 [Mycoplasma sp.]|nr:hypothetical protein [Mycoplasma sp.]
MKEIAILIAEGFEDVELIATIDHLTRNDIRFKLFSIDGNKYEKGSYFAFVNTIPFKLEEVLKCDALFIPGGKAVSKFKKFKPCVNIINKFNDMKKGVFAICAAPLLLENAGILKNVKFTAWPGLELKNSTGNEVEVDKNIITGRDYLSTLKFAEEVVKYFKKLD